MAKRTLSHVFRTTAPIAFAAALAAAACAEPTALDAHEAASSRGEVVYDDDDRLDVYAHPDPAWRTLATESTVALMSSSDISVGPDGRVVLAGEVLQNTRNLCPSERFLDHPTTADCSGTLIAPDLVLTAGHCVVSASACAQTSFVFDYYYAAEGTLASIEPTDVYTCDEIVVRRNRRGDDYAIIRLSAPALDRTPAPIRRAQNTLQAGDDLGVIGFGSGVPAKIDTGGHVRRPEPSSVAFRADLDTFGGNSGSGVYDADGRVLGILVSGETDYRPTAAGCSVVNTLDEGDGSGESVVYIERALDAYCADAAPGDVLCGSPTSDAHCTPCEPGGAPCADDLVCTPTSVGNAFCTNACVTGDDCGAGTVCGADGACHPTEQAVCMPGGVGVQTSCGGPPVFTAPCAADAVCEDGRCVASEVGSCGMPIALDLPARVRLPAAAGNDAFDLTCGPGGDERVYTVDLAEPSLLLGETRGVDVTVSFADACDAAGTCDTVPVGALQHAFSQVRPAGAQYVIVERPAGSEAELSLRAVPLNTLQDGDTCASAEAIAAESTRIEGTLEGYSALDRGSCAGRGPERFYTFTLDEPAVVAATASGFDTVLYLRRGCAEQLACDDDSTPPGGRGSHIEATLSPGTYTLALDAYNDTVSSFTLDLEFTTSSMANGQCGRPTVLEPRNQSFQVDLRVAEALQAGSCAGAGPEVVYSVDISVPTQFSAEAQAFFGGDPVLHMRTTCARPDTETACVDDSSPPGGRGARIDALLNPGTHFLIVDSFRDGAVTNVDLTFEPIGCPPPQCVPGEQRCEADGLALCTVDAMGCQVFAPPVPCPSGETCALDQCIPTTLDAGPGDAGPVLDAGPDAGPGDAGPVLDAGPVPDAGPVLDAGPAPDAGPVLDAGPVDAGQDAGPGDAGSRVDAGTSDAWPPRGETPVELTMAPVDDGCACSSSSTSSADIGGGLLAAALLLWRRRRRG